MTVLFTDFMEFSKSAEYIEPEQLVKSIDLYFRKFDRISSKYKLEKIKTIVDSYMRAGRFPTSNTTNPKDVVRAAKEMMDFVQSELYANDGVHHLTYV